MTSDIKRILVPVDFSAGSRRALHQAVEVAKRFEASIHLIHVCDRPAMMGASMDGYWSQELGVNAQEQLAEIARHVRGVRLSTEVRFGHPASILVEAAATHHADLIVMGTHGHGAAMRFGLGSVAEGVVKSAPCPVLTIREPRVRASESFGRKLGFAAAATAAAIR
jgi:nucleotide-binding universal stress UspA family protein